MDSTTRATVTHKMLLSAMSTTEADDGIGALDNIHVLSNFPDALTAEASSAFELLRQRGLRNPGDRELLLSVLVAVQGSQLQDLRERLARLELEKSEVTA